MEKAKIYGFFVSAIFSKNSVISEGKIQKNKWLNAESNLLSAFSQKYNHTLSLLTNFLFIIFLLQLWLSITPLFFFVIFNFLEF